MAKTSTKSKAERAAAMRAAGKSIEDVMKAFKWSRNTAIELSCRGRRMDAFRAHHREYTQMVRKLRGRDGVKKVETTL